MFSITPNITVNNYPIKLVNIAFVPIVVKDLLYKQDSANTIRTESKMPERFEEDSSFPILSPFFLFPNFKQYNFL
jgi:hypothetical protein